MLAILNKVREPDAMPRMRIDTCLIAQHLLLPPYKTLHYTYGLILLYVPSGLVVVYFMFCGFFLIGEGVVLLICCTWLKKKIVCLFF